ncbi:MAG: VWA domain-containing protein [Calditrichaeota bacterium]|nr:VWA domain-containing protein [Calditrichota bacterium]MCB9368411.1 VWA domain-containing protein [Calditrichota bacterium]
MIRFEHPELLWLLLLIPVVALAWVFLIYRGSKLAALIVPAPLLNRVAYGQSSWRKWTRMGIWLFAATLLIVAVARPQVGTRLEEVKREGVDVLIAVDVSSSMLCEDYAPSRLESAKFAIQKFVNGLKGDRVGMIAFAGSAVYHCPLTTDYSAVKLLNRVLNTSIVPEPGTAVADAIRMATQAFSENEDTKSKVLIIITDGEDHEEDAITAAAEAHEKGVTIYTIGMGTPSGAPIPQFDAAGRKLGYKKDAQGQVIVTQLNEERMMEIADAGGGKYQRATPGGKELDLIWSDLSKMEQTEFGQMQFTGFEDRYMNLVFPALLLLILEFLIGERSGQFAGFGADTRRKLT